MVKVGYELPKRYLRVHLEELTICLLPLMTIQWLLTSACIKLAIPNLSFLTSLIIGSCVICIDPVLSQGIAKGPFADQYVRRHLREFISAEAGANDGFGFPFLLLSISILRYDDGPDAAHGAGNHASRHIRDWIGQPNAGRLGGNAGRALAHWAVEGVLYMLVMGAGYGVLVGFLSRKALSLASKRGWIDKEGFFSYPIAIGLFIVGTCGCFGSDETLACFVAGCALNWDGKYHFEVEERHDSFNSTMETILNIGTFVFVGAIMPWDQLHLPKETGVTISRLVGLGFLILVFRRIPAIMMGYRFLPKVCNDWKEALRHRRNLIRRIRPKAAARPRTERPRDQQSDGNHGPRCVSPEDPMCQKKHDPNLVAVVYWLVCFSIVVHGLSTPALNCLYKYFRVPTIRDHPVEIILLSETEPIPNNSVVNRQGHFIVLNNRFSCVSHHNLNDCRGDSHCENSDTVMLRRRDTECGSSLERASTSSSRQSVVEIDQVASARNMI
ncbi:unnamed protein product [Penicillium salamii]|nr:unnamed protein product [Penicillium salamii]